jgi:copper chaperone CopZ
MTEAQVTRTVRWQLPGILERPAVGTSCCASTAEAIVAQELSLQDGVTDFVVDMAAGTVEITYRPDQVVEAILAAALADVGYPPE